LPASYARTGGSRADSLCDIYLEVKKTRVRNGARHQGMKRNTVKLNSVHPRTDHEGPERE